MNLKYTDGSAYIEHDLRQRPNGHKKERKQKLNKETDKLAVRRIFWFQWLSSRDLILVLYLDGLRL